MSLDTISLDDICKLNPLAAEWHPKKLSQLSTRISDAQSRAENARSKDVEDIEACLNAWKPRFAEARSTPKWLSGQVSPTHQHAAGSMSEMPDFGNAGHNAKLKVLPGDCKAVPAPLDAEDFDPAILLGSWTDNKGNGVTVDAYAAKLMATLSRHPRQDVNLKLRPLPDGGWACGNAVLDLARSTSCQLHWVSPSHYSVWTRPYKAGDDMFFVTESL